MTGFFPRVLLIVEEANAAALRPIVDHIHAAGGDVHIEQVPALERDQWAKFSSCVLIDKHQKKAYDFMLVCTHNGNPNVYEFQKKVRPSIGCIDIEHDLFSHYVEVSPKSRSLCVLAFTKPHELWLNTRGYKPLRARWYKLDNHPAYAFADVDPSKTAVVIGTTHLDRTLPFDHSDLFSDVFYKPYSTSLGIDATPVDHECLPRTYYATTASVASLPLISRFWFTVQSSAYVEALMFGCIPILYRSKHRVVERVTDIIDMVSMGKHGGDPHFGDWQMLAVTADDRLPVKLDQLRSSPHVYGETLRMLSEAWLFDDLAAVPAAHEAVVRVMREKWRNKRCAS